MTEQATRVVEYIIDVYAQAGHKKPVRMDISNDLMTMVNSVHRYVQMSNRDFYAAP